MRAEFAMATHGRGEAGVAPAPARPRFDRFELGLLAALAAVSVWVLALDLWQVIAHGRVWTGTDGFFVIDQLQYLAWIRDASHHALVSNLFVLRPTPADYFQPAITISGAITALGIAPWVSLLLWKPVAVAAIFFGARAYVHHSLEVRFERRVALALGLFFGSFTVVYGDFGVVGDLFPGFLSWGYPFGLIAVAAMLFALLAYDRDREAGRIGWSAPVLGALASSLHPWQGELLILIVIGVELAMWRARPARLPRLGRPAVTVAATALPLVYYLLLGMNDASWRHAREASKHAFSFWTLALALAPLVIAAAAGYRRRPKTFIDFATRVWPAAAVLIYLLSASTLGATPLHAFEGITIPLAVISVEAVRRANWGWLRRRRTVAWLAVAVATIPATAYELSVANQYMSPTPGNANFIAAGERDALDYLHRDPRRGGVLTRFYLGSLVPGRTGRRTFVGNCLWSEPGCVQRAKVTQALFDGTLAPALARSFVQRTGARFMLADCEARANLRGTLSLLIENTRHFGCATVYELAPPGQPVGRLAESGAHAAVRAARRQ